VFPESTVNAPKEAVMLFLNSSTVEKAPGEIETWETPAIELWDAWLFAELDAGAALRRWWDALPDERGDAFIAYVAALDREAVAANALESRLGRSLQEYQAAA
jgi:hypothetical protein